MPDTVVTQLHLLRHGEVEALERRVVRGQMDLPLSARGEEQSTRLTNWLSRHAPQPDRLFSSDLVRCATLGRKLAAATGAHLELTPELREQNMGEWQGQTWEEITRADGPQVTAYWDNYVDTRPPGGESLGDLSARIGTWWSSKLAEAQGGTIFVVTHVGVIRALLCTFLGVPASDALRFAPPVASHTSLVLSAAGAVLNTFGERPWLEEPNKVST